MDKFEAEGDLKLIREVMERSARYTHLSGLSGVIAGLLALAGVAATMWVAQADLWWKLKPVFAAVWISVFVLAIAQDLLWGYFKARKAGQPYFTPATWQVLKAVAPGVFVGFVISMVCLVQDSPDAIPPIWALAYGTGLCAAGIFTVKEVRIFGIVQLLTGAVGLVFFAAPLFSLWFMALAFGLYHIVFGIWMAKRYGW